MHLLNIEMNTVVSPGFRVNGKPISFAAFTGTAHLMTIPHVQLL